MVDLSPHPSKVRPLHDSSPGSQRMFALKRADLRDLNFIGWAVFALVATIAIHQSLREGEQRDFVYFYAIGYQLNHFSAVRLYDFSLQKNIVDTILPDAPRVGQFGPFAYPPHTAMFFQPFAMLPYWTTCRLWLVINLILYLTGLCLLIRRFCGGDLLQRSLFLLFGLSFWPFINWILLGGQLSAIGFVAMALEPAGRFLIRIIPVVCLLAAGLRVAAQPLHIRFDASPALWYGPGDLGVPRAMITSGMQARPGKQMLIVRYAPNHFCYDEWVYNDADIDGAQVVWAREMSPERNRELIDYFKDRQVWLVEPDKDPPAVSPYPELRQLLGKSIRPGPSGPSRDTPGKR